MRGGVRGFSPAALRAARADAGLRTDEVARLLGVTRQAVTNWENGAARPGPPMLAELARVLRVHAADLVPIREADLTIGDLRAMAGLTQARAAEVTGIAVGLLAEIERGMRPVEPARVRLLANAYGLPPGRVESLWRRTYDSVTTRLETR